MTRARSCSCPEQRCSDIAKALNDIYAEHDLLKYRTFGYGHSFGVLCHYYGREAGLELREDCDTVLEPGMVVSMEPMIMIPEGQPGAGGYREHDILVITENGNRNITLSPMGRSTTSSDPGPNLTLRPTELARLSDCGAIVQRAVYCLNFAPCLLPGRHPGASWGPLKRVRIAALQGMPAFAGMTET